MMPLEVEGAQYVKTGHAIVYINAKKLKWIGGLHNFTYANAANGSIQ